MIDQTPLYQEWLAKVDEDEFAGTTILATGQFPAPACFHFQQMAEKSLKALLLFYQQPLAKVHDLIALATQLKPYAADIETIRSDLEQLSPYYIETRYPGDYPDFTVEECRAALIAASNIKQFVLEKINVQSTS